MDSISQTKSDISHASGSDCSDFVVPVPEEPLVGAVGQEYVHSQLSSKHPVEAIKVVNKVASLQDEVCQPLLGLLDQLGLSRNQTMSLVLEAAKQNVIEMLEVSRPEALTMLLHKSFPYVGVPELREIPLACIGKMTNVPAEFLKQLANDKDLFVELPTAIQTQVYQSNIDLLQSDALPYILAYVSETGTLMRALDMDEFLPPKSGAVSAEEMKLSPALRKLVAMTNNNRVLYRGIAELVIRQYAESESTYIGLRETAFCSLRGQLLMALHDNGSSQLCSLEPLHRISWTLDACHKDGCIDSRRIKDLVGFFTILKSLQKKRDLKKRHRDWDESCAESSVTDLSHNESLMAEAGMILREPPILHLIIHQILRKLENLVENEISPSSDEDLLFMTQLVQLAMSSRDMLRERSQNMPLPSSDITKTLYPIISTFMLEVMMRDADEDAEDSTSEVDGNLMMLLLNSEPSRVITQIYCLERLASDDVDTAYSLLTTMVAACHKSPSKFLYESAAFASSLSQRLVRMVKEGLISPTHKLWEIAVDKFLIRSVDADVQVHEEVLRLLLMASSQLSVAQVAQYLAETINCSKKSRRSVYHDFVRLLPALDESVAPVLHKYLNASL